MTTILFVHGTGIRRAVFDQACSLITRHTTDLGFRIEPCYWGDLGARFNLRGASIPDYDTARGIGGGEPRFDPAPQEAVSWTLLIEDPLYVLRLCATPGHSRGPIAPGSDNARVQLQQAMASVQPDAAARSLMEEGGVAAHFEPARQKILESVPYQTLRAQTKDAKADVAVVMQAVVAQAIGDAQATAEERARDSGLPDDIAAVGPPLAYAPDLCQSLAEMLTDSALTKLFGPETNEDSGRRGIVLDAARNAVIALTALAGTHYVRRRRGAVSDAASPFPADILFYQARGERIRELIHRRIEETAEEDGGPIVVLGHSLGGVACVELLIETDLRDSVRYLVTAGSQAPLFYEMDMLRTLPVGTPLPDHFPPWLNLYDRSDFLSYVGERVFPDRVTDQPVDNRRSFPDSHSAYWSNTNVWQEIRRALAAETDYAK